MRSPEGQEFPNKGCYLEIVPNKKLVWTDALGEDFRPNHRVAMESKPPMGFFTAMILLEPAGQGTKYTAIAIHDEERSRKTHEEMGFHGGWGTVLEQLVAYMKGVK